MAQNDKVQQLIDSRELVSIADYAQRMADEPFPAVSLRLVADLIRKAVGEPAPGKDQQS
jgi:hypothetical protein